MFKGSSHKFWWKERQDRLKLQWSYTFRWNFGVLWMMFVSKHKELSWLERNAIWSALQTALSQKSTHMFILIRFGSGLSGPEDLQKTAHLKAWLLFFFFFLFTESFQSCSFFHVYFLRGYSLPGIVPRVTDVTNHLVWFFFNTLYDFIWKFRKD